MKEKLNKIIASHTGQPLAKVEKDTDRDFYLTPEEAKKYGLIDEVIGGMMSRFALSMQDRPEEPKFGLRCCLGVGGSKDSLIVHLRDKMHGIYKAYKFDAARVVSEYPPAADDVEEARLTWPKSRFDQFYNLKDVAAGSQLIFPVLLKEAPCVDAPLQLALGIDTGKHVDETVGWLWRIAPSSIMPQMLAYNLHDVYSVPRGLKVSQQAEAIDAWLNEKQYKPHIIPGCRHIETNGIGYDLYEALAGLWGSEANGVDVYDDAKNRGLKSYLVNKLRIASQNGCVGISDEIVLNERGETAFNHFDGLTFDTDEKGQVTWEHSDYLAAGMLGAMGT